MTNEEFYVAVALNGWKRNIERAEKIFSGLSDRRTPERSRAGKKPLDLSVGTSHGHS